MKLHKKMTISLLLSVILPFCTGATSVKAAKTTTQPSLQSVQIESTKTEYQIKVRIDNDSNVVTIDFGTKNPFGGMPSDFIFSNVRRGSNGTWTASLGPQIPTTFTIFRRLWIQPEDASGNGPTYSWENNSFNITYKVAQGDTLYLIAKAFNLPLNKILAANTQFRNPNIINSNQIVNIPRITPIPSTYIVSSGDTMYTISKKFGVSIGRVIAVNPEIQNPNVIYPDQQMKLPQLFY
jgi:LysM repeat protein